MLRFELGRPDAPRGHAILYARSGAGGERVLATYCVVLPISFSIGKYLPPILAGQVPLEALQAGMQGPSAMPIPPLLEDVPSLAELRLAAEHRGDDLCDMGTIVIGDDGHRLTFAAEASAEYTQLYETYRGQWPAAGVATPEPADALEDFSVDEVVASMLPERNRLGEMARLIGQARYAIEGGDARAAERVRGELGRIGHTLPAKYRADAMVAAALRRDAAGPRLAELYLQRAYRLADEQYVDIPPIEREIHDLLDAGGESVDEPPRHDDGSGN